MSVWVLTRELNEYDQFGEYFVAVFPEKPHHSQLTANGVEQEKLKHTLNGGGRVGTEYEWFHLREIEFT